MKAILSFSLLILMFFVSSVSFADSPGGEYDTPVVYELSADQAPFESNSLWTDLLPLAMAVPVFSVLKNGKVIKEGSYEDCQNYFFQLKPEEKKSASVIRKPTKAEEDQPSAEASSKGKGETSPPKKKKGVDPVP